MLPLQDNTSNDEAQRQRLADLLASTLPMDEVVYAFGYGSGVFSQQIDVTTTNQDNNNDDANKDTEPKVVDMIVVVKDALKFHQANLAQNPSHYASFWNVTSTTTTKAAAAEWCTWWQRHTPPSWIGLSNPGVYFVLADDALLKYGVVQVEDLCTDLEHWKFLYLAGRMHKPILPLLVDETLDHARSITHLQQTVNLPGALALALWRLSNDDNNMASSARSSSSRAHAIYTQIAQLSYQGDLRVRYGAEDPDKIAKLVHGPGQLARFERLYAPAAAMLRQQGILSMESTTTTTEKKEVVWTWDASPASRAFLQGQIPLPPRYYNNLNDIVAPAARYQSFKGIVTAGPVRAWTYAARKLAKGVLRRR